MRDISEIEKLYSIEEKRSLKKKVGERKIKVSNREIREIVERLVKERDRVLLSSVSKVLLEKYSEGKSNSDLVKMRVRVMSSIKVRDSRVKLVKEEGRVWIIKK